MLQEMRVDSARKNSLTATLSSLLLFAVRFSGAEERRRRGKPGTSQRAAASR